MNLHACRSSSSLSTNEVSEAAAPLCSGPGLRDFQIFQGEWACFIAGTNWHMQTISGGKLHEVSPKSPGLRP
ncbi:hypothetical protein AOX55_00005761 (plasmid) [Sinorhizobium fredii CCBAU 25509]|nr:hypothetical protein AOX55_00005761 [Sinorhizobium fredii CCBAU 25509]